jgi:hypothetical protein
VGALTNAGINLPAFYSPIVKVRIYNPIASGILKSMTPGEETRLELNVHLGDLVKIYAAALPHVSGVVALESPVREDHQKHTLFPTAFCDPPANGGDQEGNSESEEDDGEHIHRRCEHQTEKAAQEGHEHKFPRSHIGSASKKDLPMRRVSLLPNTLNNGIWSQETQFRYPL